MRIVTDSKTVEEVKDPDECNVFKLYKLFASADEQADLATRYRAGGLGYGTAKQELFEVIERTVAPLRERYLELIDDPNALRAILRNGASRAREIANQTISDVRASVGVGERL